MADNVCSVLIDGSGLDVSRQKELVCRRIKDLNPGEKVCFLSDSCSFAGNISSLCPRANLELSGFTEYGDMCLYVIGKG